jgi:hypothetical protein
MGCNGYFAEKGSIQRQIRLDAKVLKGYSWLQFLELPRVRRMEFEANLVDRKTPTDNWLTMVNLGH